jgi:hypothetical protein
MIMQNSNLLYKVVLVVDFQADSLAKLQKKFLKRVFVGDVKPDYD